MLLIVLLLALTTFSLPSSVNGETVIDVTKNGAKGDGRTDDTEAFQNVWKMVCPGSEVKGGSSSYRVIIPSWGKFILHTIVFEGPCNAETLTIQLDGQIIAPNGRFALGSGLQWVKFSNVENLVIEGKGTFIGDDTSGKYLQGYQGLEHGLAGLEGEDGATNAAFHGCSHLRISGISSTHSQKNHISISSCDYVDISNIHLTSPADSRNTDGIDITHSSFVTITDSDIKTGDDCIEINTGTHDVNITNVNCGPGHGISIGSFRTNEANVENIHVQHCTFTGTTNGARIKTHKDSKGGFVRSVTFQDITLDNVKKPIIIDQTYDDYVLTAAENDIRPNQLNGPVDISNIKFVGFEGTCSSKDAITLLCNPGAGCTDITMSDVHITGSDGQSVQAICTNAHGSAESTSPQVNCLNGGNAYADDIEEDERYINGYV